MREIKFRAWDEGNKKMHTGVEFIKSGDDGNDWICISSNEQQYKVEGNRLVFDNPYCRQQIHLMQFTGLKDKNGIEIYEGDILNHKWTENEDVSGIKNVVQYANGAFGYYASVADEFISYNQNHHFNWVNGQSTIVEVIGNIYSNPELLNQK